MFSYTYVREKKSFGWDINNPNRTEIVTIDEVDVEQPIYLAKEIEVILDKHFHVCCNANECKICFEKELTTSEITLLNTIVDNHKNNL